MSRGRPGAAQVSDEGLCHYVSTTDMQRSRAVWAVCGLARDAEDAATILEQLGLSAWGNPRCRRCGRYGWTPGRPRKGEQIVPVRPSEAHS